MGIMQDPVMQSILQQAQNDPAALQEHMKSPVIRAKIQRLVAGKRPLSALLHWLPAHRYSWCYPRWQISDMMVAGNEDIMKGDTCLMNRQSTRRRAKYKPADSFFDDIYALLCF